MVASDGVQDGQTSPEHVEQEDTAMAAVESPASGRWLEERDACCDGGEASGGFAVVSVPAGVEAEERRCSMELAVAVGEGGGGEDAAPELADERGVYVARGVSGGRWRRMSAMASSISSGGGTMD